MKLKYSWKEIFREIFQRVIKFKFHLDIPNMHWQVVKNIFNRTKLYLNQNFNADIFLALYNHVIAMIYIKSKGILKFGKCLELQWYLMIE